jgi:hypothetical protein
MERIISIDVSIAVDTMMRDPDRQDRWEAEYIAHCDDQGLDPASPPPAIHAEDRPIGRKQPRH